METFRYLEHEEISKLVSLNRKFSQTFLKYNSRLFIRMHNLKVRDLLLKLKDLTTRSD